MARRSASKLRDEQKAFLTKRLAVFDTPKEAADALNEQFGVQISPQAAEHYDPNRAQGRSLAGKWVGLFSATRKRFLDQMEHEIPLANQAVRVKKMAKAAAAFEARGAWMPMVRVIEAISRELGGVNTNRRELAGRDGRPLDLELRTKSDAQLRQEIMEKLGLLGLEVATDPELGGDDSETPPKRH